MYITYKKYRSSYRNCNSFYPGFKNWKSWYMFFHAPNNMFAYTIVYLTFRAPQIVICEHMCEPCCAPTTKQKYFRVEGKLEIYSTHHQPSTQSGCPNCFYRERNNRRVSCLPRTKQPDKFLSTVFESNEHGWSFPIFWFKTAMLLGNILSRTSRLCRNVGFAQINQTSSNTHIMAKFFANFHN